MSRPLLLDLFCGAGGAAMGYSRAGFDIIGIDIRPQPHYPFDFIQADALSIDITAVGPSAIHASPPCQAYIQRNKNLVTRHPKLIEPVRKLLLRSGLPYVIENVPAAPLINPVQLCGTGFGLKVLRHRVFETPFRLCGPPPCNHRGSVASGDYAAVYKRGGKGHRHGRGPDGQRLRDPGSASGPPWAEAMGIDWMADDEMIEAIPPVYTGWIGEQLLKEVEAAA